jgi:hypothetical protein
VDRFASYCRAAAAYVVPKVRGPHFFTPINEITFFSFCAGEWGGAAPYRCTRDDRMRLRLALCRAAIAGVKALPLVSTVAIVLIIAIIVALNQNKLLTNGLLMFAAVILHNLLGFALGYLFARLFGMDLAKRKAVMFETGMQNSGLGAALAAAHFSPLAAVPSALFSVWHNLSGSALATWFAGKDDK